MPMLLCDVSEPPPKPLQLLCNSACQHRRRIQGPSAAVKACATLAAARASSICAASHALRNCLCSVSGAADAARGG